MNRLIFLRRRRSPLCRRKGIGSSFRHTNQTAASLGVGFCPVPKDASQSFDSDPWVTVTSPPDYKDRHLKLGLPKGLIRPADRVVAVDDLIDGGGQLLALQSLVGEIGATWIGASVLIDNLKESQPRLNLKSVFHIREL